MVKASLTESIMGNILLVLGVSMLAGGVTYERQKFNQTLGFVSTDGESHWMEGVMSQKPMPLERVHVDDFRRVP